MANRVLLLLHAEKLRRDRAYIQRSLVQDLGNELDGVLRLQLEITTSEPDGPGFSVEPKRVGRRTHARLVYRLAAALKRARAPGSRHQQ